MQSFPSVVPLLFILLYLAACLESTTCCCSDRKDTESEVIGCMTSFLLFLFFYSYYVLQLAVRYLILFLVAAFVSWVLIPFNSFSPLSVKGRAFEQRLLL